LLASPKVDEPVILDIREYYLIPLEVDASAGRPKQLFQIEHRFCIGTFRRRYQAQFVSCTLRLKGSRRLDHIIVSGEAHLRRILISCAAYYNDVGTHRSLDKDVPIFRPIQRSESFVHTRSSVGFTIITSGFEFSVHTADAGAVRPAKPPARLSQPPLAEALFYSAIDDREGVSQLLR